MTQEILATRGQDTEEHWISISDMMAGLMVIFLFIAISYMLHIRADKERIEQIAVIYEKLKADLYIDLQKEFEDDLDDWNAVLDKETLSMTFYAPDVLFKQGSKEVRPHYKTILNSFFPRYVNVLTETKTESQDDHGEYKPKYLYDIAEIRIEGHTSSEWYETVSTEEAYILNMELSQGRSRSVLEYVLQITVNSKKKEWLKQYLTANGLSSSQLKRNDDGTENKEKSRRVAFRVRTNAEKRIVEILKRGEEE